MYIFCKSSAIAFLYFVPDVWTKLQWNMLFFYQWCLESYEKLKLVARIDAFLVLYLSPTSFSRAVLPPLWVVWMKRALTSWGGIVSELLLTFIKGTQNVSAPDSSSKAKFGVNIDAETNIWKTFSRLKVWVPNEMLTLLQQGLLSSGWRLDPVFPQILLQCSKGSADGNMSSPQGRTLGGWRGYMDPAPGDIHSGCMTKSVSRIPYQDPFSANIHLIYRHYSIFCGLL